MTNTDAILAASQELQDAHEKAESRADQSTPQGIC